MDKYNHPGSVMNGWSISRRTDLFAWGLIEAFCPHGVGHPIPESVALLGSEYGVHGCDRCCTEKEERNE